MHKLYTGNLEDTCPYMLGEPCRKVCPTCKFQQQFRIPTGQPAPNDVDIVWDCALLMQHKLTIEGNARLVQIAAETNAFRNETIQQNQALLSGTVKIAQVAIKDITARNRQHAI